MLIWEEFMGSYEMYLRILNDQVDEAGKPLSIIFEKSQQFGEVLPEWKRGNITPIFKKWRKEDLRNYGPAGLTSIPSRIMKEILWNLC